MPPGLVMSPTASTSRTCEANRLTGDHHGTCGAAGVRGSWAPFSAAVSESRSACGARRAWTGSRTHNAKPRPLAAASALPRSWHRAVRPRSGWLHPAGQGGAGGSALRGGAGGERPRLRATPRDGDRPGLRRSPHQASSTLAGLRAMPAPPRAPGPPRSASPGAPHLPELRIPLRPAPGFQRTHAAASLVPTQRTSAGGQSPNPPRVSSLSSSWPQGSGVALGRCVGVQGTGDSGECGSGRISCRCRSRRCR